VANTDNGTNVSDVVSYETAFQQDFNSDGIIGGVAATIESLGTTTLSVNANNQYIATKGGVAVNIKYAGADVGPNSYGGWSVVGAEITEDNLEVRAMWKTSSGQFWYSTNTDNGGIVSGGTAIAEFETVFQQDFDNNGVIGFAVFQ
jgi:hypothetical protein